jgi:hypothetical protein
MLVVHAASKCLHVRIPLTSPLSHTTLGRLSWNELLWLESLEQDLKVGLLIEDKMNACEVCKLSVMDLFVAF